MEDTDSKYQSKKVTVVCYPAGDTKKFPITDKEQRKNRYKVLHRLKWKANYDDKNKTESDQYDISPTVNFVCKAPYTKKYLGSARVMPMKHLSMLRDAFSDVSKPDRNLVAPGFHVPDDAISAEISRLVVRNQFLKPKPESHRPDIFKQARDEVIIRLYVAILAYCRFPELRPRIPGLSPEDNVPIEKIFGISYVDAWEPVFAKRGLKPNYIGEAKWVPTLEEHDPLFDDEVLVEHIQAGWVEANWKVAEKLCEDYGLEPPYFITEPEKNQHHKPSAAM